jgi:methyl-accepting chemotaxis protein
LAVVAQEVKTLAASSAQSTERISQTLARLDVVAGTVAEAIVSMSREITGLEGASSTLAGVASRQFSVVNQLDTALASTVQKVTELSTLSKRSERRIAERREVQATIRLRWAGASTSGEVRDMSATGLRFAVTGGAKPLPGNEVEIEVESGGKSFSTPAMVAREIPVESGVEYGLFFTRLPESAPTVIAEILGSAPPPPRAAAAPEQSGAAAGEPAADDLLDGIDLF